MKRFSSISIILTLAFFFCLSLAYGQEISRPAGRISSLNNQWKPGGIFYGKAPQQEILEGRTAYTKKFDRGNGLVDIYFGGPYHYTDESGAWQDINLSIKPITGPVYGYSNTQNQFVSLFSKSPESGVLMRYKNASLAFGINTNIYANNWRPAASAATSKTNRAKINYAGIFQDIDLGYEVTTSSIRHSISFRNQNIFTALGDQNDYITVEEIIKLPAGASMMDEAGMLNTSRSVKGNIFIVAKGDSLFYIQSSCIWDAAFTGNPEEQVQSPEALSNFKQLESSVVFLSPGECKLLTLIPVSWLKDPARVYPVTLDPTVGVGNQTSFNSSYRYPFNTCRQQRVSQLLFRKSDINAGGINTTGTITSIDFFQNAPNPIANNNVQIKMQEVSWNEMTTPTLTSAGFTPVYGPVTQNFTSGSNTWQSMSLSTPFAFTNTMNLLIDVRFANTTATSGCTCANTGPGGYWGWYNSPYAGHRWAYSNSAATPPSGADCEYNNSPERNPAYGYFIPATRITINTTGGCVPVTFNTQPQAQTVSAPAQAQFSVSVAGTAPVYQWEMSTNGGSTWANVPAATPYSGTTTSQLTVSPTINALNQNRYRCKVSNTCTSPTATSNSGVLTINQPGCTTVLTPTASSNISASGGTGSFAINVNPNSCFWSASENQSWLNITSALNGTNDATLNYSVTANTGGPRSAVITVNGQTYTVNQLGAAAATTYTISGRVIENGSIGLPGVTISTTPNQGTAITDAQGYYTINVPLSYTGVVKASLAPYVFQPASQPVSSSSRANKDFDADAVSISITSTSIIPPWQRENDDYSGTIDIQMQGTTGAWHIEADVYDANNMHIGNVKFLSSNTSTSAFAATNNAAIGTPQRKLFDFSKEGYTVRYSAVFDADNSVKDFATSTTKVIERKWDKKNVVFFNNTTNGIKIPIKWTTNLPVKIRFSILNHTARKNTGLSAGIQLKNLNGSDFISSASNGYFTINPANSNIREAYPADYKYEMFDASSNTLLEQGTFDFTKIGKINSGTSTNKAIVIIGGIFNEMESSAVTLKVNTFVFPSSDPRNPENINSSVSYSLIEYCRSNCSSGFSTWYIAQGNSNFIKRNGYDIGIGLQEILRINPGINEINIIAHSKGGLDTRALLSGFNQSMLQNSSFDFSSSNLNGKVKKVIFLGTPHYGAHMADFWSPIINWIDIPGAIDLMQNNSNSISVLNTMSMPLGVHFLNITGYREFDSDITDMSDQVVRVPESEDPSLSTTLFSQGYQQDARKDCSPNSVCNSFPNDRFHMNIHKNIFLNYRGSSTYQDANCTGTKSNLIKVKEFLDSPFPYAGDFNCGSIWFHYYVSLYGSKITGANVFLKSNGNVYKIGRTDGNGKIFFNTRLTLGQNDSLLIKPSGYEALILPIVKYKNAVAFFRSPSSMIINPSISTVAPTSITSQQAIQVKVESQNAIGYMINQHSSDSIFIPMSVTNNIAMVSLDTGYNRIVVKFIGNDTTSVTRIVYYLPGALMNDLSFECIVNTPANLLGAKVYVDNQFNCILDSSNKKLRIINGISQIKFSKPGYKDTLFLIQKIAGSISLSMQPYSYSSLTDSNTFNFQNRPNPQYWNTITLKDLSPIKHQQISAMQFEDAFPGMALKPQTRKFVFRNLAASGTAAAMKTAIALDQINTPDKDSVYLLSIKEGRYFKYKANQAGITEYDPDVQKVEFDQLAIGSGQKQEIVLMQKQAPIMKSLDTIWHSGQTISFPVGIFVTDPDSIKNDIFVSSADLKVTVTGNRVNVTAPVGFVGTTSFSVTAEHDFIQQSRTYLMKVIPPEVYIPSAFTPNADGLNDIIRPAFLGKVVSCRLLIYNRNGQKVFDTEDCLSGWDGKIRGQVQDPGAYIYYLRYQFAGEEEKETKGSFVLLK